MSEDQANADNVIAEIDSILIEEDPEFIKELGNLKIDNAMTELSLMDEVLANVGNGSQDLKSFTQIFSSLVDFRYNAKMLVPFWILIFIVMGSVFYMLKIKNWNASDSLFLTSYAEWGLPVYAYNPATESEMFFDNSKLFKNIITLNKMVANIKASENSSPNPMLAFELNVEGLTSEVVVEIKDREAEFKDMILRTTEEFSYDDLLDNDGKINLEERLVGIMNANLTRGQIRKVLYKSFILKN